MIGDILRGDKKLECKDAEHKCSHSIHGVEDICKMSLSNDMLARDFMKNKCKYMKSNGECFFKYGDIRFYYSICTYKGDKSD